MKESYATVWNGECDGPHVSKQGANYLTLLRVSPFRLSLSNKGPEKVNMMPRGATKGEFDCCRHAGAVAGVGLRRQHEGVP